MKKEQIYNISSINSLDTDFKAEVVALGLINSGIEKDEVVIVRQRGDKREVSKDVYKIEKTYSGYDLIEYLYINTNRGSIYDSLPEGIFHNQGSSKKQRSREDIIKEIRQHRNEEVLARKFFQPFEMVIDELLIDAQLYEQRFDKAYIHDNLRKIFEDQWNILSHLSLNQSLLFLKIIPIISEISQNFKLMENVLTMILDCPISITQGKKSLNHLSETKKITLGKWKLGISSVIGKTLKSDNYDLLLTIGPIDPETMRLFEFNAKNDLILQELISLIIPFDRNTTIRYKIDKSQTKFRLSTKEHKAYLGINTTL